MYLYISQQKVKIFTELTRVVYPLNPKIYMDDYFVSEHEFGRAYLRSFNKLFY